MPEIENHLGTLRQKRGISAAQLARTVGVTRQTIYAMEAGSYVPNTAVALRLAQALEVKVEDLFALPAGRTHRSSLGRGDAAAGLRSAASGPAGATLPRE